LVRTVGQLALRCIRAHGGIGGEDTLICVALAESGLVVVNVADPANPVEIGHWKHPSGYAINGVAVSGTRAYCTSAYGLRVISLDNPAVPVQLRAYPTGYSIGVVVRGDYAYVATWDKGLTIYDLRDSLNPSYLSRCVTDSARTVC